MSLFVNPIPMGQNSLFLVLPLCAVVGVVYKTIRTRELRRLPLQILWLWAYLVAGLIALGIGFWVLVQYF